MANQNALSDNSSNKTLLGVSTAVSTETASVKVNPTTGAVLVESAAGSAVTVSDTPGSTITTNQVAIAAANTAVRLNATATTIKEVRVRALAANTAPVYVGTSAVTTANGHELAAGQEILIKTNQLNNIYFNGATVGSKVSYIATN